MASTASDLLKFEKQATGENSSTWGTKANTAMSRLEEAIADITNVSLATLGGAGYTLDDTQYAEHVDGSNTSESHVAAIKATGVLSADEQITVPLRNKVYWVWNATTGSFAVTVGGATGTTTTVPQGYVMAVICDGTNVEALTAPVTTAGILDKSLQNLVIGTDVQAYDATIVVDADIGVTVQAYDADTAKLDVVQAWTAAQRALQSTVTDGTLNLATAQNFVYTPSGADTLEFSNETAGQSGLIFLTNGSNYAITFGAEIMAPSGAATAISATGEHLISYAVEASGGGADTVKLSYVTVV